MVEQRQKETKSNRELDGQSKKENLRRNGMRIEDDRGNGSDKEWEFVEKENVK